MLSVLFFELLSFTVSWLKIAFNLNLVFLIFATLIVFCLSVYKLEYGLYIAILELIIGSKGHYLSVTIGGIPVSIRIGIFLAVFLAWFILLIRSGNISSIKKVIYDNKILIVFGIVCLWGLLFGIILKHSSKNVLLDFNAWLYFLYIFPFLHIFASIDQYKKIAQIFCVGVADIILKTFIFLFVFSHNLPALRDFYKWGRDTGWGEFTLVGGNLYRIFSQAQIFVIVAFFLCLIFQFYLLASRKKATISLYAVELVCLSVIIISLSRSFWVSFAVCLLAAIFAARSIFKLRCVAIIKQVAILVVLAISSYGLILAIINAPIFKYTPTMDSFSLINSRFSTDDAASSSRWAQLPELFKAISQHPVLGSGWGKTIAYKSFDPRILSASNPDGWYTTYAFEWGYLDLMLKIGLLGLIVYLVFIFHLIKHLYRYIKNKNEPLLQALSAGLLLVILMLLITHGFSPYLNHPLGIGLIVIIITVLRLQDKLTTSISNQ